MTANRPSASRPVRARAPAPSQPLSRSSGVALRPRRRWSKERRGGAIACITIAFASVLGLSVYGVHLQTTQSAKRAAERDLQIAIATGSALKKVSVLFVPDDGQVCRRRWMDNGTWTLRDGGEINCEDAAMWNVEAPDREQKVERRIGAIRDGFQARSNGKPE
jgi:hypothetical protein